MKVAFDTNVLVYAEGINGVAKQVVAGDLIPDVGYQSIVIPAQVLGELFNVLTRKAGRSTADAGKVLSSWNAGVSIAGTSAEVMMAAAGLAIDHQLSIWDAMILATASHAGCRVLLSEDMQHGFTWGGVTVVDAFASPRHPSLRTFQSSGDPH